MYVSPASSLFFCIVMHVHAATCGLTSFICMKTGVICLDGFTFENPEMRTREFLYMYIYEQPAHHQTNQPTTTDTHHTHITQPTNPTTQSVPVARTALGSTTPACCSISSGGGGGNPCARCAAGPCFGKSWTD